MSRAALIEKIRQYPDEVEALIEGLSESQMTAHAIEGEWTLAQNIHHLADSHVFSFMRYKRMLTEDNPSFNLYDEDAFAETYEATVGDVSTALAILRALHMRWVVSLENLTEAEWARTGYHPTGGDVTVERQFELTVAHGEAHLAQIQKTKMALE